MKKLIIMLMLLPSLLNAAEWKPDIRTAAGWNGTGYPASENMHSSAIAEIAANPASFAFGPHLLSFPVSAGYTSSSIAIGREMKQAAVHVKLEAEYGYIFTELLTLRAGIGIRAEWHLRGRFLTVSYGASVTPWFKVSRMFSIGIPVSFYGSASGWGLSAGAALSVLLL